MDSLLRDLKFSARSLLKRPALTIIAIVTLAIGIGANSAIFSTINALLLKPLPFPDPERIVALWDKVPSRGVERNEVAVANYLDWRAQNKTFEQLGLYRWWSTNLTGSDSPERVQGFLVTANFLDIVGVKPMLGSRFFRGREPARQRRRSAAHLQLVATSLRRRSEHCQQDDRDQRHYAHRHRRDAAGLQLSQGRGDLCAARDHSGVGAAAAAITVTWGLAGSGRAFRSQRASRSRPRSPASSKNNIPKPIRAGVVIYPILEDTVRMYSTALWVMMAAVGFVLLIGCANVANLMLARATGRQREIALRSALGASRFRIVRQLLTESVLLGLAGGVLGILVAYWGVEANSRRESRRGGALRAGVEPSGNQSSGVGVHPAALCVERRAVWIGAGVAALETGSEQCVERRRQASILRLASAAWSAGGFRSRAFAHAAGERRAVDSQLPAVGQNRCRL